MTFISSQRNWMLATLAFAFLILNQPTASAQKVIRLGFSEGTDTPHGQTMTIFGKLVESSTQGRYQVRIFPNLQLGPINQELQSVRLGSQEMFISTPAWFSGFYPKVDVLSLPYMASNWDEAERLLTSDALKKIAADAEAASGIKILGTIPVGFRNMATAKKLIAKPEDLAGLKIRVQNSPVYLAIFKALGANPVAIDSGEIFLAVQNGVVDGLETTYPIMQAAKYYQVAPNISETRHNFDVFLIYMNKNFFQAMSPEDQKAVEDSMRSASIASIVLTRNAEDQAKRGLVAAGAKLQEVPKETLDVLRKSVQTVYEQFKEKFEPELSALQKAVAKK
jgi:tripartite ATP-independent transporter DctP family solute receptor